MLITTNALITREYRTGNRDRVLHLITEDHGRISVMVKGGGSERSRAAAAVTQPYTWGNYELYLGRDGDLYWFRGGSVLNHFFDVTAELSRTALAAYLCDVATELSDEDSQVPETATLLRMLLNTLHLLANTDKSCTVIKAVFEWRAAALMGFCPDLTGCARCGEVYPDAAYLDIMNGRLLCADCQTALNRLAGRPVEAVDRTLGERRILVPITPSALAAMRYTLAADDRKIFAFALTGEDDLRAFSTVAETYLLNQLEQDFDTLRFYRSVSD